MTGYNAQAHVYLALYCKGSWSVFLTKTKIEILLHALYCFFNIFVSKKKKIRTNLNIPQTVCALKLLLL
jgi:hypothetical protein